MLGKVRSHYRLCQVRSGYVKINQVVWLFQVRTGKVR
jgi:hypothetical protein